MSSRRPGFCGGAGIPRAVPRACGGPGLREIAVVCGARGAGFDVMTPWCHPRPGLRRRADWSRTEGRRTPPARDAVSELWGRGAVAGPGSWRRFGRYSCSHRQLRPAALPSAVPGPARAVGPAALRRGGRMRGDARRGRRTTTVPPAGMPHAAAPGPPTRLLLRA